MEAAQSQGHREERSTESVRHRDTESKNETERVPPWPSPSATLATPGEWDGVVGMGRGLGLLQGTFLGSQKEESPGRAARE